MPTTISCPECHRALALPAEVMNRVVQCPACKHAFHPAAADAIVARPVGSKSDYPAPRRDPPVGAPRMLERSGPPAPPLDGSPPPRRSRRREEYDVCPQCKARMQRGVERCPECGVEFEAEADDRPWERSGVERRDSEPGRGGMILFFGITSIVFPLLFFCPYAGLVASALGMILGICAWIMGAKDLHKIDQHVMAREARGSTHGGMVCGIIGSFLSLLGVIVATLITVGVWMA